MTTLYIFLVKHRTLFFLAETSMCPPCSNQAVFIAYDKTTIFFDEVRGNTETSFEDLSSLILHLTDVFSRLKLAIYRLQNNLLQI